VSDQPHVLAALPPEKSFRYPFDRVGPRGGLNAVAKRKKFSLGTEPGHMGYMRNVYKILVGWENIFRIDIREIWREDVDWMHLAQDRDQWKAVVNTVMNLRVP
jgi:hypothetical protein